MLVLYIFRFLHQTTTYRPSYIAMTSCISFVSYIKPQLNIMKQINLFVVYLSFPTSNHNTPAQSNSVLMLYIFRFLHQTTTPTTSSPNVEWLYIFRFLHQTTTCLIQIDILCGCISFVSYIKPQLTSTGLSAFSVVYLSFPTSNHNL